MPNGMMHCPRCDRRILTTIVKGKVELEQCPDCRGLWLDAGELARLAGTSSDLPPQVDPSVDGLRAYCPKCEKPMNRRYYSDSRAVLVDECRICHGVWLDDNELLDVVKTAHSLH